MSPVLYSSNLELLLQGLYRSGEAAQAFTTRARLCHWLLAILSS